MTVNTNRKRGLLAGLGITAIVVLVVVLAQFASLLPFRLDLTEDGLYTLTDGTKSMLKGMETPVKVDFYYSAKLAEGVPQIGNYAKRVEEMLREYQRLSRGRMTLNVIDPEPFSAEEDKARELGLMSVPVFAGGPEIHFGLVAQGGGDKPEIIDFFRPDRQETLEYDLSQVLWKASRKVAPKIALVSGLEVLGGFDFMTRQPSPPWAAFAQVEQLYKIEQLPPDFDHIGDDFRLLVIVHPGDLAEKSLRAIDAYAQKGGAVLVFVDPNAERAGGGMFGAGAQPSSDLKPLFAAWGVDYDPTQVLADAHLAVPVASSEMGRPAPHLGIQQFGPEEFPRTDPVIARLERLHTATAGVLAPHAGAASMFTPLIQSSDQAMLVPAAKFAMLDDHTKLYEGFQPTGQRYVVAARISGKVGSAFAATTAVGAAASAMSLEEKPANIIIVADTDILSDRLWVRVQDYMGQQVAQAFADNGDFFINAVDSMMGSANLMSIRGRGRYDRPFDVVDQLERQAAMSLQSKQQELEGQLQATEAKLGELQSVKEKDAKAFELNEAQVKELEKFVAEKARIRKELREVQHRLGSDIESLGGWLKFIDILLAPFLLVLAVFGIARWRLAAR